jgi:fructosamine-3-kinase
VNNKIINSICASHRIDVISAESVSGGDINHAFKIKSNQSTVFLKLNSFGSFPGMFAREAEGLHALQQSTTLKVPQVIAHGEYDGQQYLLLEYLEKATARTNFWQQFAQGLSQLHEATNDTFGWTSSNYIGSLQQQNEPTSTWDKFYAEQRILPLCKTLFDEHDFSKQDIITAETLCKNLAAHFPKEQPSLLHGDLWSGNFMIASQDEEPVPAIFDPAVYYGHREMDIGMSLLFGGFDKSFYDHYNDCFPLEKNWRKRIPLTQLYPLLVHAILFGGGYVQQCRSSLLSYQ